MVDLRSALLNTFFCCNGFLILVGLEDYQTLAQGDPLNAIVYMATLVLISIFLYITQIFIYPIVILYVLFGK